MRRFVARLSATLVVGLVACQPPNMPVPDSMPVPNSPISQRAAWHAARVESLRRADGWLTLVGLDFLRDGSWSVGNGSGATFRYANCTAAQIGRFEVAGDAVRFVPTPSAAVTIERGAVGEPLIADDKGAPSVVVNATMTFTLVRRNGTLALRVRDSASAVRAAFQGIELFDYQPSAVVKASVTPALPGQTVTITNVKGFVEEQPVAAVLDFELGEQRHQLIATSGSDGSLFVVFADQTSGAETYGGGRFLDIPAPIGGNTTIDFNRAINPPCCFTAFATCPLPPAANHLSVRVVAGERLPKKLETSNEY